MDERAVRHVQQPNEYTCVPACAAMVLDADVALMIDRLKPTPKGGTPHRKLIAVLRDHGVRCGERFMVARGKPLPHTAIVRVMWPEKRTGHVVLKHGRTWHDPQLPGPFTGDLPETREWANGGRVTSFLWIGDGMP